MEAMDKKIINYFQSGLPVCERPFLVAAEDLGISEEELIARLQALLDRGVLSRFGPLFDIERMGGTYSLAAMQVPADDIDRTVSVINSYHEVAHNYERDHKFNLWFVVAIDSGRKLTDLLEEIGERTGYTVYNMPKLDEYFVGLKLDA